MTSLHDDLAAMSAVLVGQDAPVTGLLAPEHGSLERRVSVYRNNRLQALIGALFERYPVCASVVGEACFRTLAQGYVTSHPSRDASLFRYGREFPHLVDERVQERPELSGLPWLVDLAVGEDLLFDARHRPRSDFDFAEFAATPETERRRLELIRSPGVGLMQSNWNIDEIHQAHQGTIPDAIELRQESVLLVVDAHGFTRLEQRPYQLMSALTSGASLEVLEARTRPGSEGRIVRSLVRLLEQGWITLKKA